MIPIKISRFIGITTPKKTLSEAIEVRKIHNSFDPASVLAKSDGKNLLEHIEDCLKIFQSLCNALPKLPALAEEDDFFDLLFCAVYIHDWGKAHEEFQKVLNKEKNVWYSNRHEFFSVPFIEMLPFPEKKRQLIAKSVLGHHKDFDKLVDDYLFTADEIENFGRNIPSNINPRNFSENLLKKLKISYLKELKERLQFFYDKYALGKRQFKLKAIDFKKQENPVKAIILPYVKEHNDNKLLLKEMFLSGATKICDHMGSAEISDIPTLEENQFGFLDLFKDSWYPHQKKCYEVEGNLMLTAPTGSGKTEAALFWLRRQIESGHQGRIFYILPYTASINAMHQRLISLFEKKGTLPGHSRFIGVVHGKLRQYLSEFFEFKENSEHESNREFLRIKELHKQLVHPFKVVTPFQILKYFFGVKGFEMGITELAGAMLIFDEIHAYDVQTFAQIVTSLQWMNRHLESRTMVMTATMPSVMQVELKNAIQPAEIIKADNETQKKFVRHRIRLLNGNIFDNFDKIENLLKDGKRVIVVCNSVKNAQEIFKKLNTAGRFSKAILLHSRFIFHDRQSKEQLIFQDEKNIQLLVGTQAIEVSLDIDFDTMFTEPAPIDALIQRFGRINRKRNKGICTVRVCKKGGDFDRFIYPEQIVKKTLKSLESVDLLDEEQLQSLLDEVYPELIDKDLYNKTQASFSNSLTRLKPLMSHKEDEMEFYSRFTGISVLPIKFQKKYEDLIRDLKFIEAEKLMVTIQKNMFYRMASQMLIEKIWAVTEKRGKLKSSSYFLIRCDYSNELGLLESALSNDKSLMSLNF